MALLKKLRSSTLMETMVATVLIVVIFAMASVSLNSLFAAQLKGNTQPVMGRLQELAYQYKNGLLKGPYFEKQDSWEIQITIKETEGVELITLEAQETRSGKKLRTYEIKSK